MVRPLEAFDNKIRAMPHLFKAAPAMTKHWALRIGDDVGSSLFEIGIQDGTQEIYAALPVQWEGLQRPEYEWIPQRVGYTVLNDNQIYLLGMLPTQQMKGPAPNDRRPGNNPYYGQGAKSPVRIRPSIRYYLCKLPKVQQDTVRVDPNGVRSL
jgi:hypothetical protein